MTIQGVINYPISEIIKLKEFKFLLNGNHSDNVYRVGYWEIGFQGTLQKDGTYKCFDSVGNESTFVVYKEID